MSDAHFPPFYYRCLIVCLAPFYRLWLAITQQKRPFYATEICDRFGCDYKRPLPKNAKVIWCHAVSLGELNTAYPLLLDLLQDGHALYITTTTQTGYRRIGQLFGEFLDDKQVVYGFVPIDDLLIVYRFLMRVRPSLALFVETELWANTLFCLKYYEVPSVLINARLKERSFLRYQKFAKLAMGMMNNLSLVICQDKRSYQYFLALGLSEDKLVQADSLKWSQNFVQTARPILPKRPTWVAASTHAGEEEAVLTAHRALLADFPWALLILVPRHPERFDEVAKLCQGFVCARRSKNEPITDQTQVYLADTMGELLGWYQAAQAAFVGGSLVEGIGGHNPIEPIAFGVPVVMGRHAENCEMLLEPLMEVGAAVRADKQTLAEKLTPYLTEAGRVAGQAGQAVFEQKKDAYLQQKAYLLPFLS